ncbi:MAG TPA: MFS transporter [Desulfosalsimonadaceae bacterium]|nr:MFS transporter [Desulfosalsimonadaceae bacterium]
MIRQQRFHTRNVLSVSLAHFVHDVYSSFLAPILPLLIEKLSISYSYAGLLAFCQRIPSLFNFLIGMHLDKLRIRYFVIFAPAVTGVCMSLLGLSPHYIVAVILLLSMGVSGAFFHVPAPVVIREFSGDRVGRGMSFYMLGGEIARTLGPIIILAAVSLWGLEGTYRLIPFGAAASLWLFMRFRGVAIEGEKKEAGVRPEFGRIFQSYLSLFLCIAGIILFRAFMKSAIINFLPTYLSVKGQSLWFGGLSLSVFEISGAAGTFLAGTLSDRLGRTNTLFVITVLTPLLMLLFVFSRGFWVIPVLVMMGFFMLSSGPVVLALVMDQVTEHRTFMNGIYMSITFISDSVTALLIGLMGDWLGLVNTFMIAAFLALLAIPFVFWLSSEVKKHRFLSG